MRKISLLIMLILTFTLIGCGQKTAPIISSDVEKREETIPMSNLTGKKILMVIAHKDYQDIEYGTPKKIFEEEGAQVVTASTEAPPAQGKLGGTAQVDVLLSEVSVPDYEAIIFVGGPGAMVYVGDEEASRIASEALEQDKVLGAICIAPMILAKAGVLQGKKATVWHATLEDDSIQGLKEGGAEFIDQAVVEDGKIITANGPGAAEEFGEAVVNVLAQ